MRFLDGLAEEVQDIGTRPCLRIQTSNMLFD
jgi:hypothetical protein